MALVLDGDNGIVGVLATNTDGDVIFDTNTLFVDAVENKVGIGTTTPDTKLHVSTGTGVDSGIRIQNGASQRGNIFYDGAQALVIHGASAPGGGDASSNPTLHFATGGTTPVNRMSITRDGNVGIGTTNPTSKLHADGAIVSTNLAQGTGELQIQGYGNTGYINMNGSGSLIFRMGSSYSQDLKLTSAGILQGVSDAEIATSPIRTHSNTISTNTTIDANDNAVASGPLGIADGVTLTINGNMTVV